MGRPVLSEAFLLKAQTRQKKGHCDPKLVPLCDSEATQRNCFKSEEPADPPEDLTEQPPDGLESEERLAAMIQRIFPVERDNDEYRARPPSKSVTLRLISKPTRRTLKNPGRVEVGLPPEAARLALLRKDRMWDPKAFPLRKNSIDLVKGACAQTIERLLGGNFVFIQEAASRHGKKRKGHPLHDFREKLLKKWPTIQDAFSAIDSYLSKVTKPMNLQEWATTLSNLGLASQADGRVIYELLDENKDGDLTLEEFHWGIETVAPVLCMETLRKRLLCLGFPSMTMALSAMHGPGQDLTMLPLSLERFAECLCRAWIIQPEEHKAIFEAIRNPNEPSNTVTLSELLCGLAGVSPPLVLEDLATALRPRGRLAALKDALGVSDEQEEVSAEHWRRTLGKLFHFNDVETSKLLPMMDVDGIDGISMEELQSVLVFAEPSMFVEGSRKKVQQGYRSIESALQNIINESDLRDDSKFGKEELELLLESVEGVEMWEMAPVVSFVSGSSGIGVSISGFLKGLRLFAPCCVLEALRMQLITKGMSAFKQVPNHRMPLDREAFAASLKQAEIKLSEEETLAIFDLLDVRSSDVVTISELVALLQCSRPKGRPWRAPTELKQQVAFNVHQDIAPIQSGLQELKQGIRVALKEAKEVELEEVEEMGFDRGAACPIPSSSGSIRRAPKSMTSSSSAPELRRRESANDPGPFARRTFQRITSTLSRVPDDERGGKIRIGEIREELGGYFESQHRFVRNHEELLLQPVPKAEIGRAHV